mmetsp:Transcript_8162/g.12608  ORF Transcript_8162/g.12608 Transcript_8162/m.12608 type:complete len:750 (+) Transcript_8162:67-2316(+)
MKISSNAISFLVILSSLQSHTQAFATLPNTKSVDPFGTRKQQYSDNLQCRGMPALAAESTDGGGSELLLEYPAIPATPGDIPSGVAASSLDEYKKIYEESLKDDFWANKAKEMLDWDTDFSLPALSGDFEEGDMRWFSGGKLNVCYNAIDRHAVTNGDRVAMIWEGDEPTDVREITYTELLRKVSKIANALQSQGVKKGDVVTIYMPMIPELAMTMLACARLGAVHSVVFGGFSAEALAQRISAAKSRVVVTADVSVRGSRQLFLKRDIVDSALEKVDPDLVDKVLVYERFYDADADSPHYTLGPKDVRMDPLVELQRPYSVPEIMDSEENLFILYTSGSTGQPKGLVHTTGGYALWAAFTTATTFHLQPDSGDIFACLADAGWITGHTYAIYGPLLNGGTTVLFESTPLYPDAGRYWDMVQRHKINIFYTAPTAIRSLMRFGDEIPGKYDLSSLKVLGSVGEPINPEAWRWYYQVVGRSKCTVVDTYWQTETGGHIITNLPGVTPMKPGSCTLPMYGVDPVVLDPQSGEIVKPEDFADDDDVPEGGVKGVLAIRKPWPGMARTCLGDHQRYMMTYLKPYGGYYFTGDAVYRDKDGYHFIIGRVDDVLNVSGHRIGTAEVESALVANQAVAQAAVVGQPHPIKGQSICAFVTLTVEYEEQRQKDDSDNDDDLVKELRMMVRKEIGPFASPDIILVTPSLPMTRSGKIMRRILRKIVAGEVDSLGDTSTLADPSIVDTLITKMDDVKAKV